MYGNYDGTRSTQIKFDIYLGVDLWQTVNITSPSEEYYFEVATVAPANFIWICLVDIGSGTPFISALELRPLASILYPYCFANQSNSFVLRYNYGPTTSSVIRYPKDPYDRLWPSFPYDSNIWMELSSNQNISRHLTDNFLAPFEVLRTAVVPVNGNYLDFINWTSELTPNGDVPEYYAVRCFTELEVKNINESHPTRQFDLYLGRVVVFPNYIPLYLMAEYIYSTAPMQTVQFYSESVKSTPNNATLPPFINADEVYSILFHVNSMTGLGDVNAISAIQLYYKVQKNWMGDPCTPKTYAWAGLACNYLPRSPRIVSVDLSHNNLSSEISDSFANLSALTFLDLSYNNLTGPIPANLADIAGLRVLNLTGNSLCGEPPQSLLNLASQGYLIFRYDSKNLPCGPTPTPSQSSPSTDTQGGISTPVVVGVSVAAVALIGIVAVAIWQITRHQRKSPVNDSRNVGRESVIIEPPRTGDSMVLTYSQLENMTNGFSQMIGEGGFGIVYHGYTGTGQEVAVKLCPKPTTQATRQFHTEVESLKTVHHINLVSLVGYCNERDSVALVYEYMSRGSLHDSLRGRTGSFLNWVDRLRIAFEAARGLEYLHTGCEIIHRDVKSSNILLDQNLQAKVADFGLAKLFDGSKEFSLASVSGTPGYIDPEYSRTLNLTPKSDVYSFGVVLLELITGKPPIMAGLQNIHIVNYVNQKLAGGSLENVVDSRLQGSYEPNSAWRVIDLALRCTQDSSMHRPTMPEVVTALSASFTLATGQEPTHHDYGLNSVTTGFSSVSFAPASR